MYFQNRIMNTRKCSLLFRNYVHSRSIVHSNAIWHYPSPISSGDVSNKPFLYVQPSVSPITVRGIKIDMNSLKETEEKEEAEEADDDDAKIDRVANELALDLANVFIRKITVPLYNPLIELDDKIRGQTFKGILLYIKNMHLLKIVAHMKFPYVRPRLTMLTKYTKEKMIVVEWQFVGLGFFRMMIRYIPDKLYRRANMDAAARVWFEGVSTFYLDEDWKIYKHVVEPPENRDVDQTVQQMRENISQKLKKMNKI